MDGDPSLSVLRPSKARVIYCAAAGLSVVAGVVLAIWGFISGPWGVGIVLFAIMGTWAGVLWLWANAELVMEGDELRVRNLRRWSRLRIGQLTGCEPSFLGLKISVSNGGFVMATVLSYPRVPWDSTSKRRAQGVAEFILDSAGKPPDAEEQRN